MKKILMAVVALGLTGCSTTDLENGKPIYSGHSLKSPEQINKCLAPKWIEFRPSSTSIPTEHGYQISSSDDWFGALSLVTIKHSADTGSDVKVYAASAGWNDPWGRAARSCM